MGRSTAPRTRPVSPGLRRTSEEPSDAGGAQRLSVNRNRVRRPRYKRIYGESAGRHDRGAWRGEPPMPAANAAVLLALTTS
eukprot:scaffold3290_cov259-Pinguiococcus_pyrenoidosus.AAC.3